MVTRVLKSGPGLNIPEKYTHESRLKIAHLQWLIQKVYTHDQTRYNDHSIIQSYLKHLMSEKPQDK